MSELKLENGIVELKFTGVRNLQTIKRLMQEKVEKYNGIVVTEDTLKDCKETLAEIKPVRADIKKVRATVNKELTAAIKEQLKEIDDITEVLTEVIEPLETQIEKFEDEKRKAKLEEKKFKFQSGIDNINLELSAIELPPFYILPIVEFSDDWATKSDNAISQILLDKVEEIKKEIAVKNDRIDLVKTTVKLLQQEWGLVADINWLYLKEEVYQDNWKKKLEEMASFQQEQEFKVAEKERKIVEAEAEKKIAEIKPIEISVSDSKKEFKVRIDCVLSADTFEKIEEFIKASLKTDRIKITNMNN